MAKKKVKFELKQDVLAECNKRIRDRLLKKPISLKPNDYLFKAKVDIEVADPEWDKKAIERSLYLNIKRSMQLLSVRANKLLEDFDEEADPQKPDPQVKKLKKALLQFGKEVADQGEYNLEQIIDDITKDVAKWGKAGETLNAMKAVDKGDKALEKTVGSLGASLIDVVEKIKDRIDKTAPKERMKCEKDHEKKLASIELQKKDQKDDYRFKQRGFIDTRNDLEEQEAELLNSKKTAEEKEQKKKEIQKNWKALQKDEDEYDRQMDRLTRSFRFDEKDENDKYHDDLAKINETTKIEVRGFIKDAGNAFATYRKDRGEFNDILKDTAKKMHKMVDSKSKDNKAIAQLQDMLKKKVKPAADAYGKDLEKCDKQILAIIARMGGNKVSKKEITDAMPKPGLSNTLFKEFKAVKDHMKREKIQ